MVFIAKHSWYNFCKFKYIEPAGGVFLKKLGLRLKSLRNDKGITQTDLGNIVNVGKSTISQYESGISSPDYDILQKLADYFNVSLDYLLGRTDNPKGILDEPSDLEIEHVMKNNQLMFNGDVMTAEEKEDVLNFIRHVLRRERQEKKE